ncbi:MAG: hypothetical protein RLZ10_895 [Bacteroidota bacterium]|jgi:alpha-1,3-rhamnosyltransferase
MDLPLVTVFTLIYNTNPKYVIEAIKSVQASKYPNIQHIIIDDCSPDSMPKQTIKKWIEENNYPCEFYEHEVNYGICKTLNHVLHLAKGEFILGCSDDKITTDRIKKDVQVFSTLQSDYAIVFSLCQVINSNSELQPKVFPSLEIPSDDNYWHRLLESNCIAAPAVTYRVESLKKIGGFKENFKFEDYEIYLRLSSQGYKFKCLPEILTYYRIHNESISMKLNFDIEDIRILSSFSDVLGVKKIVFEKVWDIVYLKKSNFPEAKHLYEFHFSKHIGLKVISKIKSRLLLRILCKIFPLKRIKI